LFLLKSVLFDDLLLISTLNMLIIIANVRDGIRVALYTMKIIIIVIITEYG